MVPFFVSSVWLFVSMESSTLIKEMERENVRNEMGREKTIKYKMTELQWFNLFMSKLMHAAFMSF